MRNFLQPSKSHVGNYVVKKNLCCGNGVCAAICPVKAISISTQSIYPIVDEKRCIDCGLCIKYCPGLKVDFPELNKEIFNNSNLEDAGNFISSHIGYSMDQDIRYNSSSGGIVTSLLIYALENKIIDGAFVAMSNKDKPWISEPYLATTKEELLKAQQSRYMIIPMGSILSKLNSLNGKYAFVGVPCTVHGLRMIKNPLIKNKIAFIIGLYCGHNYSYRGVEYMIKKVGFNSFESIRSVKFREGNWPGNFQVIDSEGREKRINKHAYNLVTPLFLPYRCKTCIDLTNDFADIAVGDAWLPEYERQNEGYSIVLCRTKIGQTILGKAKSNKYIDLIPLSKKEVYRAHQHTLNYKKKGGFARIKLLKSLGYPVPEYGFLKKTGFIDYMSGALFLSGTRIMSTNLIRKFIFLVPMNFLSFIMKTIRKIYMGKSRI